MRNQGVEGSSGDLHDVSWREGLTVQDVLDHLKYSYSLITVSIGEDVVEPEHCADTPVPDGSAMTAEMAKRAQN